MNSELILTAIKELEDQNCWGSKIGLGSNLIMQFGKKVIRTVSHNGNVVSRSVKGEYDLLVFCSWRIESNQSILCVSQDTDYESSYAIAEKNVHILTGLNVSDIIVDPLSFNLTINFTNDIRLKIFCDVPTIKQNNEDYYDNYYFSTFDTFYSVSGPGIVQHHSITQEYISE